MKQDLGFIILKTDNTVMYEAIFKSIRSIIDSNPYNQICVFNSHNEKTIHIIYQFYILIRQSFSMVILLCLIVCH